MLAQVGNEKQNPNYESNPLSKAEKRVQAAQAKAEKWEKKLKLAEGRLMKDWLEFGWLGPNPNRDLWSEIWLF